MIEFYGSDSDEEGSISRAIARDSEDKYLSPNDDEDEIERAARGLALPEGTQASSASGKDSEIALITAEIEKGCRCSEDCYQQFSAILLSKHNLEMNCAPLQTTTTSELYC